MMRWIIGSSLKFRFLVVAIALAMMVFGFGQLRSMPVDVFPEFAPPRVEIQTPCLGLSASEVESLVTVPLEHALTGVPGLEVIRSKSVNQLSSIELIFEPGVDLLFARQVVQERVDTVKSTLPTWASPPFMMQPLSATSRVMKIGLWSNEMSLRELSLTAYWKIRARLLRVPGVANVPIWGERIWQLHVQVDPQKMRNHGVTLEQVMQSTADALDSGILRFSDGAVIGTGGFVDTQNQRLTIRHVLPIITADDLAQVAIRTKDGSTLRIGDVAEVVEDHPPLAGEAVINDGPGLMLIVEKLPWGNTLDVTRGVEAALAEMRPGLWGIEIDSSIFRPATFVEMAIDNLSESLLIGVVLMIVVLVAFLFDWRSALISTVTIPLSLTAAGLVLYFRGATINTMILAGFVIALGAVVDDAIVDIENIVRRLRENRKKGGRISAAKIILDASLEVRGAVVYASMIEALALLPVFFLTGLSGSFFRPLALSYALAVLVSMIVALVVTPALSMILLSKADLTRRESPLVKWLVRGYARILSPLITKPRVAYAVFGIILISGTITLPKLGQDLLPAFKERDFLMHWVTAPGTSLEEETRITTAASRELRSIDGVRNFGAHIGQALLADEVVGVEFGENWISIDPKADYEKTVKSIQDVVDGYPGLKRDVLTYLKERIREVLTGEGDAIVIKIYGQDLEILRSKAEEVKQVLSEVDSVVEEHIELQVDIAQVEVEVNLAAAQRWGIKPGDVRRAAATLVASEEVGDIYRDGKAYDVHVWSTPQTRNNLTSIRELPLDTPSGTQIRLADVAEVRIKPTPNAIFREGASRSIVVGANVRGQDLGSVVEDISDRLENVQFPLGYHAKILGEDAERQSAQNRLLTFAAVAIFGIFILLFVSLGSLRLATLSFVTLPMALVGGVLAAFAGGGVISLGSLVGFFTVLGIVARNGIMLISHYQYLEQHEGETFGPKLILRGSRERLAPILMTALTTALALVPLVIFGNIPGQEIEYPMAIVILGGLVTSTLLNLFVVPSLYLRFGNPLAKIARSTKL